MGLSERQLLIPSANVASVNEFLRILYVLLFSTISLLGPITGKLYKTYGTQFSMYESDSG